MNVNSENDDGNGYRSDEKSGTGSEKLSEEEHDTVRPFGAFSETLTDEPVDRDGLRVVKFRHDQCCHEYSSYDGAEQIYYISEVRVETKFRRSYESSG